MNNLIDGMEPVNHDALLGKKPSTDWSMFHLTKKEKLVGALFVVCVVALIVGWFHFWVKPHDKALESNSSSYYHFQHEVTVQP